MFDAERRSVSGEAPDAKLVYKEASAETGVKNIRGWGRKGRRDPGTKGDEEVLVVALQGFSSQRFLNNSQ